MGVVSRAQAQGDLLDLQNGMLERWMPCGPGRSPAGGL